MSPSFRTAILSLLVNLVAVSGFAATPSPTVFFNTLSGGAAQFSNTVTGAGGTVSTDTLSGLASGNSWTRTGYTITSTDGNVRNIYTGPQLGGEGISMNASTSGGTGTGLTFTFDSPVNAFSLQLRDWATCCTPSSLYISFDGGTPILVGTATTGADNPGQADNNTYIGAIDDTGNFTTITFYGQSTGSSDALSGGGIISWARLTIGALSGGGYVNAATSSKGLATYLNANEVSGTARATLASYLNTLSAQQVDKAMLSVFPTVGVVGAQTTNATAAQTTSLLLDRAGTVLGGQLTGTRNFFHTGTFTAQPEGSGDAMLAAATKNFNGQSLAAGASKPLVSKLTDANYAAFKPGEYAVWVEANAGTGQGEKTTRTLSYTSDNQGLVMGVESAWDERTLFGVLFSPNQTQVSLADGAGKTDIDTHIAGVYAQRLLGQTKLTGTFNFASSRYQNTRNVDTGSGISSALADYHGTTLTAAAGLSRLYKQGDWFVEPFVQGQYVYGRTSGYTEGGAGTLNMQVDGSTMSQAALSAGATFKRTWESANGKSSHTFAVRPAVRQTVELDGANTNVSFVGSGSNVLLPANSLTQTEVQLGAQYQYAFNPESSLTLGYDTSHNKTQHNHAVMVGYGYRF